MDYIKLVEGSVSSTRRHLQEMLNAQSSTSVLLVGQNSKIEDLLREWRHRLPLAGESIGTTPDARINFLRNFITLLGEWSEKWTDSTLAPVLRLFVNAGGDMLNRRDLLSLIRAGLTSTDPIDFNSATSLNTNINTTLQAWPGLTNVSRARILDGHHPIFDRVDVVKFADLFHPSVTVSFVNRKTYLETPRVGTANQMPLGLGLMAVPGGAGFAVGNIAIMGNNAIEGYYKVSGAVFNAAGNAQITLEVLDGAGNPVELGNVSQFSNVLTDAGYVDLTNAANGNRYFAHYVYIPANGNILLTVAANAADPGSHVMVELVSASSTQEVSLSALMGNANRGEFIAEYTARLDNTIVSDKKMVAAYSRFNASRSIGSVGRAIADIYARPGFRTAQDGLNVDVNNADNITILQNTDPWQIPTHIRNSAIADLTLVTKIKLYRVWFRTMLVYMTAMRIDADFANAYSMQNYGDDVALFNLIV
jgi:hypothetical protein